MLERWPSPRRFAPIATVFPTPVGSKNRASSSAYGRRRFVFGKKR